MDPPQYTEEQQRHKAMLEKWSEDNLRPVKEWKIDADGDINGVLGRFRVLEDGGRLHHGYLSNGYIEPDGSFVEREYQAYAKTADEQLRNHILASRRPFGPDGAKRRGRAVPLRPDHNEIKFQVMAYFVAKKFAAWPKLAADLRSTGEQLLVEGNWWHDNIWGDCRCENSDGKHPACVEPGTNWLGLILMTVRVTL